VFCALALVGIGVAKLLDKMQQVANKRKQAIDLRERNDKLGPSVLAGSTVVKNVSKRRL
jgi:hypothetical protein